IIVNKYDLSKVRQRRSNADRSPVAKAYSRFLLSLWRWPRVTPVYFFEDVERNVLTHTLQYVSLFLRGLSIHVANRLRVLSSTLIAARPASEGFQGIKHRNRQERHERQKKICTNKRRTETARGRDRFFQDYTGDVRWPGRRVVSG